MHELYIPKAAYSNRRSPNSVTRKHVTPAKAGVHAWQGCLLCTVDPAFAGVTRFVGALVARPCVHSAARCSFCWHPSTMRWPALAFSSMDLAGICTQTMPFFLSSRRTAPVVVSSGTIT